MFNNENKPKEPLTPAIALAEVRVAHLRNAIAASVMQYAIAAGASFEEQLVMLSAALLRRNTELETQLIETLSRFPAQQLHIPNMNGFNTTNNGIDTDDQPSLF